MSKILITSALPYVNGVPHLGHLVGCLLPSDVYARYMRMMGHEVLYVCGTDEHGTPSEVGAAKEGMDVADYCLKYHNRHKEAYDAFNLSFDYFGRTSSEQNREITYHIFEQLDKNGLIEEESIKQIFSIDDNRFLPDRYVTGTCPHCGYDKARGDQCENCTKVLDPTELINPRSTISGSTNLEVRETKHLFLNLPKLEKQLAESVKKGHRFTIIVTDGVFSMDGVVANLNGICSLAEKYGALVMVDESHAAGFIGRTGRGTIEHCGVHGRVDIVTGTLGKALGGAMGGYTAGPKEVIEMLRQRSRPYLFSNSLCPSIVGAASKAFDMVMRDTSLRDRTESNTKRFKDGIKKAGLDVKEGDSSIIPVMLYDAPLAQKMAARLLDEGVYVTGFFYPVVPKGQARIRVQISAAHTPEQIDRAVAAFAKVARELGAVK